MKRFAAILAAALAALPLAARADEPATFKFAFPAPPQSWANRFGIAPWIADVNKAAEGALEIKFFPGPALGNFRNIYDRTVSGVVEMAFGTFGELTGQFEKVNVSLLPLGYAEHIPMSLALWRLYETGVIADEFQKVKPLALYTFPGEGVHTAKPVKSIEELRGLKIGVSSRIQSEVLTIAGAAPVTMIPSELYQALQRNTVDGASIGWPATMTFKLNEVTKHHLSLQTGLSPGYVFANKEAVAKLPDKARRAVEDLSGEKFARRMGQASTSADAEVREYLHKEGHVIAALEPADAARWRRMLAPIVDDWVKATPDGARVLAAFKQEVEARRARTN